MAAPSHAPRCSGELHRQWDILQECHRTAHDFSYMDLVGVIPDHRQQHEEGSQ